MTLSDQLLFLLNNVDVAVAAVEEKKVVVERKIPKNVRNRMNLLLEVC